MTQHEKAALFALVRYAMGIDDIQDEEKENIVKSIPVLYRESKRHDLAHMVAAALFEKGLISSQDPYHEKFKKIQISALFREARISHDLQEICDALEAAQIPYIPLKGSVLRNYYPEKWMRTSSDIDVLVKDDDLKKAVTCLINDKGYSYSSKYVHHVSLTSKCGIHIEIHNELLEENTGNDANLVLADIWDLVEKKDGTSYCYEMKDEHFYLYHIAHAGKHIVNGGCGIKPILDLWILQNKVKYDAAAREELIKIANLTAFNEMCQELAKVWFENAENTRKEVQLLEDYILSGGVHGTPLNHLSVQQQRKGGKLGYAKDVLFPPYEVMSKLFPVLQKHKWLLGFYYIIRFPLSLFKGTAPKIIKILKVSSQSPKEVDEGVLYLLEKTELK